MHKVSNHTRMTMTGFNFKRLVCGWDKRVNDEDRLTVEVLGGRGVVIKRGKELLQSCSTGAIEYKAVEWTSAAEVIEYL